MSFSFGPFSEYCRHLPVHIVHVLESHSLRILSCLSRKLSHIFKWQRDAFPHSSSTHGVTATFWFSILTPRKLSSDWEPVNPSTSERKATVSLESLYIIIALFSTSDFCSLYGYCCFRLFDSILVKLQRYLFSLTYSQLCSGRDPTHIRNFNITSREPSNTIPTADGPKIK